MKCGKMNDASPIYTLRLNYARTREDVMCACTFAMTSMERKWIRGIALAEQQNKMTCADVLNDSLSGQKKSCTPIDDQ